jgi:pyruvate/2-oxoglutarate dehydrogenase complex dihydrolipoamide acyltransferase (E2) component
MKRLSALTAATFIVALAACANRAPAPRAALSPPPAAAPIPQRTPAPQATATRVLAAPSPTLTPSPEPIVMASPDARPLIVAVHINNQTVHGGDTISGTVVTSSNVASVEARIATFSISVPKVGTGRFALNYVVPSVPFFFHGTYPMTLVARNTAGDVVERVIPITVQ